MSTSLRMKALWALAICMSVSAGAAQAASTSAFYEADYVATVRPSAGVIALEVKLSGDKLPSRIRLRIDPERHKHFRSTDPLEVDDREVTWRPQGKVSRLSYEFVVDHERGSKSFDSLMTEDWALFRGDKMVPRARVTARRGLTARATLTFVLPKDWSIATPYAPAATSTMAIEDPERRFDRPEGWMLAGKMGVRAEKIGHVQATIAAPVGESARRQDTLSFLNWNLPHILEVFSDFPPRLLILSAGDPMWRGGLSGPASLFLHADRPLVSENRTSTLLHELVHVAMRLHGDDESDWIVEGLAEYYSLETLRRSGGISARRFDQAVVDLQRWARRSATLFDSTSSGSTTARAVLVFLSVDEEIRKRTKGKRSLDDVARALAKGGGEVSLARLQKTAAEVVGEKVAALERSALLKQPVRPAAKLNE
jgi:predicted metalloprotease with PDZ domain